MPSHAVHIPLPDAELPGDLFLPPNPMGIILFAHGSGSSRLSPRNQQVARYLNEHRLATLLVDLLSEKEEMIDAQTRELRFDIDLLARRLIGITDWLMKESLTKGLKIGYFGASTGAAAALIAAAKKGKIISAVVSRGGRPDLAGAHLPQVVSPTLLIVGGDDVGVIELNESAYASLSCVKQIEKIPGATHLFEERGKLEMVAELTAGWFLKHFGAV